MQTLRELEGPVHQFMLEARQCAQAEHGFAALLTLFPVILGVSEAIIVAQSKSCGVTDPDELKKRTTNPRLFRYFVSVMDNRTPWLVQPRSISQATDGMSMKLAEIRDSLSHQFSLPYDVVMVNSYEQAQASSKNDPNTWFVSAIDMVSAVEQTACEIIESNPDVPFDPLAPIRGIDRGAANRYEPTLVPRAGETPRTGASGMQLPDPSASASSASTRSS